MNTKFYITWILDNFDVASWAKMYESAGKEPNELVTEYNALYNGRALQDPETAEYNEMYALVERALPITDPEMAWLVSKWNEGQKPEPTTDHDEVIGDALLIKGHSFVSGGALTLYN